MITVILNQFKRTYLAEQLQALEDQTVQPHDIMIWQNDNHVETIIDSHITHVKSNRNFGVWARFSLALNALTPYICILDDDTIPGTKWLQNCLTCIEQQDGIYGGVGLRFHNPLTYFAFDRYGWCDINNSKVVEVDIAGHAWFFRKEVLQAFYRELPDLSRYNIVGEDMHLSAMAQRYLGLSTFIPPHPVNDISMWSSTKGNEYGKDSNALSIANSKGPTGARFYDLMDDYYRYELAQGWKLLSQIS